MKRIRIQLILYLILILIAFWISYIIIYGSGGVVNRANLARELGALEHEMNDLEKEKQMLLWEIRNLKENRRYIEFVARELGFRKKQEIIFKFVERDEIR
jgi:cell division protein FtsB